MPVSGQAPATGTVALLMIPRLGQVAPWLRHHRLDTALGPPDLDY